MNPNMSSILEALERRRSGGVAGGGTVPAMQQISSPTGPTPTGGPSTPVPQTPQMPQANPGAMPQQVQASRAALQAGQKAQAPLFDDETRELGKALIQKLLKGM